MHGETEGKRPLGRPKQMENNIKLDLKNIVGREWTVIICLTTGTVWLAGSCKNSNEPSSSIKFWKFLD